MKKILLVFCVVIVICHTRITSSMSYSIKKSKSLDEINGLAAKNRGSGKRGAVSLQSKMDLPNTSNLGKRK